MRIRPIKFLLRTILVLGAGTVALLWSSQWWLPAVAPTLLGWAEVRVEAARSVDNGRWRLEGLSLARPDAPGVVITTVELPNLWSYAWACWGGGEWLAAQEIAIGATTVRIGATAEAADPAGPAPDWAQLFSATNQTLASVRRWLPPLSVSSLRVEAAAGASLFELSGLRFNGRELTTQLAAATPGSPFALALELEPASWQLQAEASSLPLALGLEIQRAGAELKVEGALQQATGRLEFSAVFRGTNALPTQVWVASAGISVPEQLLPDSVKPELSGVRIESAEIKWGEGGYAGALRLAAQAELEGERTPVRVSAQLDGDFEQLRIRNLDIEAAWLDAALQAPLVVSLRDGTIAAPAEFHLSADLALQPFLAASGKLRGGLTFRPPGTVDFDLTGDTIRYADYSVSELLLQGRADASGIDVESMILGFPQQTPGSVELNGRYDFEQRYLDFNYQATLGAGLLSTHAGIDWFEEGVTLVGAVAGALSEPTVRGKLQADVVQLPQLRPFALASVFSWQGMDSGTLDLTLEREAERLQLTLEASLVGDAWVEGELQAFEWISGRGEPLRLTAPSAFRLPLRGGPVAWFAEADIGKLEISGAGSHVSLCKEAAGALEFSLLAISPDRLNGWLEEPLPDLMIRRAEVKVSSLTPQLAGIVNLVVEAERPPLGLMRAELAEIEFGRRLRIGAMAFSLDGAELLRAEGELPLRMAWAESAAAPEMEVSAADKIRVRLRTTAPESLAALIQTWTGLAVAAPELEAELDGTLEQPQGHVRLQAAAVNFDGFKLGPELPQPWPEIGQLELALRAGGGRLQLERLHAVIRGGSVTAAGGWPLADGFWRGELGGTDWRERLERGRFELNFADWELQNWTPYLPDMLRRSGRLHGDVQYVPDAGLSGLVRFDDFALRPTQDFPAVDSIRGELRVEDQMLILADASGRVGGSPVSVTGEFNWSNWPGVDWAVHVAGKNVPIVRRPDIILRSDLDLNLSSAAENSATKLSGRLGLRASTMLVEFDPLSPPVRSGPSARPPFFAVEDPPFRSWVLDLRIEGERFLRVRSPYFQSLISAQFDLAGTLGDPLLLGALRIEKGHMRFPGARLRLDTGEAFIAAAEPNTLRLDVSGTARAGTHVITMQVDGSAAEPHIQFEASPPLSNAAIVRLLSTGSTTGGGAGAVGLYLGRGLLGAGGMQERFGDRLSIDFGDETTRSGRNTVGIRYELEEDLSLQGEYDVYDSYNTDLLWTIYEK